METKFDILEKRIAAFLSEMPKVKAKEYGWKAAAERMRKVSLEIEGMLKEFRKVSIAEANK